MNMESIDLALAIVKVIYLYKLDKNSFGFIPIYPYVLGVLGFWGFGVLGLFVPFTKSK